MDFVPAKFLGMKLNKISSSVLNPLNQRMRVELKRCTVLHGVVNDPVDQFRFLDDSSQTVVVGVGNVCWCFGQAKLQSFVHCYEDVLLLVLSLTSKLGYLERDLDQDGKWGQNVLTRMVEGELFPILTLVEGLELSCPLDPNLALLGDVNLDVASLVLVSIRVVAPNILSTKLNSGLLCGRPDKSDQRLNVDNSSEVGNPFRLRWARSSSAPD